MDTTINNTMNFADILATDENVQPLLNLFTSIMELPDDSLNENSVDVLTGMIRGTFTEKVNEEAIQAVVQNFHEEGYSKHEVISLVTTLKDELNSLINDMHPTEHKKQLLKMTVDLFMQIFEEAQKRFGVYDIELPIKLDKGARMPTYAHDTDACADLYALNDITIHAHTYGNKVTTGVHLQLPAGWQARIAPRSSIGANSPLRMSNSCGIIDTAYTGDITCLYDNISDSDYIIKAGDRIAQMWIEPIYRFKSIQVDTLQDTERNDSGFGSTGK